MMIKRYCAAVLVRKKQSLPIHPSQQKVLMSRASPSSRLQALSLRESPSRMSPTTRYMTRSLAAASAQQNPVQRPDAQGRHGSVESASQDESDEDMEDAEERQAVKASGTDDETDEDENNDDSENESNSEGENDDHSRSAASPRPLAALLSILEPNGLTALEVQAERQAPPLHPRSR